MKKTLLIVLITLSFLNNIQGQYEYREGIVVTNSGDTISGLIGYREGIRGYKVCNFKKSRGEAVTKYSPDQIQSYGFINDMVFVSKQIKNNKGNQENVFFEVLVKGKLTLYKYTQRYFVEKYDDGLHELTNDRQEVIVDNEIFIKDSNRYIGILNYLTGDCEDFTKTLKQSSNNERDLTKLVEKYNECTGDDSISYKENKPWFKAHFGLVIGLNSSQINFSSSNPDGILARSDFDRAYSIMPGVNIDLLSPRINENISFHVGLFYLSTKYLSYSEYQRLSNLIYRTDIRVDLKQIKIPLGFRYTFSKKEITPYINGGASYTIQLEASSNFVLERESNNVVDTIEGEAIEIDQSEFGFWGGVGVEKSISEKLNVFVELRYEGTSGVIGIDYVNHPFDGDNTQNLQLLIGLSF